METGLESKRCVVGVDSGKSGPTVYVVTQGDYSDYHIVGVYSTEEKVAERVEERNKGRRSHDDQAMVEHWELDGGEKE